MRRALRRSAWTLTGLLLITTVAMAAWATFIPSPMAEALNALRSGDGVTVTHDPWYAFHPAGQRPKAGLILYPGGRVDPRAYAPAARLIAMQGFLVVIPAMPLNLAVLAPDRATAVIAAFPEVDRWAVGGHSLGGAMAARYALRHPDQVRGLVLWAAYPASADDLSGHDLAVASIYADADGLATPEKVTAARPRLPATTRWVAIAGGNHAGFGWYGSQSGDGVATISRTEQQQVTAMATLEILQTIGGAKR